MKIRVWNAFASNNSGSYTLVGSFPTAERAQEVVQVLAPLLEAQTLWHEEQGERPSPLEQLAITEMLAWSGEDDDWPQYGGKASPEIVALGPQVLLHHDYTVSLPRFLGHFFYARGGRVDTTLEHAHHPVVAVFEVYWAWDAETRAREPELRRALAEALGGPAGTLAGVAESEFPPVVRPGDERSPLVVAAVFDDLVAGVAAVQRTIERHEGRAHLRIHEAFDRRDPLGPVRLATSHGA